MSLTGRFPVDAIYGISIDKWNSNLWNSRKKGQPRNAYPQIVEKLVQENLVQNFRLPFFWNSQFSRFSEDFHGDCRAFCFRFEGSVISSRMFFFSQSNDFFSVCPVRVVRSIIYKRYREKQPLTRNYRNIYHRHKHVNTVEKRFS